MKKSNLILIVTIAISLLGAYQMQTKTTEKWITMQSHEQAFTPYEIPEKDIISGKPQPETLVLDRNLGNGIIAGIWKVNEGKWHFVNFHWEYCYIRQGVSIITPKDGEPKRVQAGDSFILPANFEGTWEVIEPTEKDFIIRGNLWSFIKTKWQQWRH